MAYPQRARRQGPARPETTRPLGEILSGRGWIRQDDVAIALQAAERSGRRLGEVAIARGLCGEAEVAAALAEQWGMGFADLERDPPDPALTPDELETCLHHRVLPWRRLGRITTYVTDRPEGAPAALARLGDAMAFFAVTTSRQMDTALSAAFGPELAFRAARRVPRSQSVRRLSTSRIAVGGAGVAALGALVLGGDAVLTAGFGVVLAIHVATLLLRTAALVAGSMAERGEPLAAPIDAIRLADRRPLPMISLLVPLYRETGMINAVLGALAALDYPRELIDAKLLVEEDDAPMRAALAELQLPGWVSVLVVPQGAPRTKPRALNHALDFCRGELIGLLDAEDRPDPQQLRAVAARFADAPPRMVAVQCQLSYYNSRHNWLSRCFELEYAIWFEVLLRGYQRLDLPLPLGGTSLYFRAGAIRRLDGWDAHNVTEDADLGVRLMRGGGRCEILRSTTGEEAACRLVPWIRQRSRWTKGYLLTWLSHMRNPLSLWRDLGTARFLALNVIFLGGALTYLIMPLFWLSLAAWALLGDALWHRAVPAGLEGWLTPVLGGTLVLGWAVMLIAALVAMARRGDQGLLGWAPTLPFYWWLGGIAAWKAMIEMLLAPYYWDKTEHGVAPAVRRQAVRSRPAARQATAP